MVKFRDYENQYKNFSDLSDEDQFLAELVKIERFDHKLKIMSFMATFDESADLLEPVILEQLLEFFKNLSGRSYISLRKKNIKAYFVTFF